MSALDTEAMRCCPRTLQETQPVCQVGNMELSPQRRAQWLVAVCALEMRTKELRLTGSLGEDSTGEGFRLSK